MKTSIAYDFKIQLSNYDTSLKFENNRYKMYYKDTKCVGFVEFTNGIPRIFCYSQFIARKFPSLWDVELVLEGEYEQEGNS